MTKKTVYKPSNPKMLYKERAASLAPAEALAARRRELQAKVNAEKKAGRAPSGDLENELTSARNDIRMHQWTDPAALDAMRRQAQMAWEKNPGDAEARRKLDLIRNQVQTMKGQSLNGAMMPPPEGRRSMGDGRDRAAVQAPRTLPAGAPPQPQQPQQPQPAAPPQQQPPIYGPNPVAPPQVSYYPPQPVVPKPLQVSGPPAAPQSPAGPVNGMRHPQTGRRFNAQTGRWV